VREVAAAGGATFNPIEVQALFDTGATKTVVREDIPRRLGLKPVGFTYLSTGSAQNVLCPLFDLRIILPEQVTVNGIFAALPLPGQPIECLIGRDILKLGVFIYIGYMNAFTFSI